MDSSDKIALITGAGQGIGQAVARLLAQQVGRLILVDIDASGLARTEARIRAESSAGPQLAVRHADVTQQTEVERLFTKLRDEHGRLDILVNAVGGSSSAGKPDAMIEELDPAQWQGLLALNLTSAFLCCRAAVPSMKVRRYGRIVNFSSIATHGRRDKVSTAYAASKAGIDGLTRKLAREVAPFGITCNALASGITLTERIEEQFWRVRSEAEQRTVLASIPLGRLSTPLEQAQVVAFLASDAASYITGQIIEVGGGI
ncbi:MAG: 3-oxoacyl-[acyl-carrier protein] reductase [Candidatus Kentron sp. G]|nr:MAG: 3-oxoacyl-[acyl-carrier protein] reductase [Candidatus Kentron sp. G]VFN01848.1 MAG: 3-oxoacyl-[acyl-carrier protein] reductase [Candidatus Kentron sp. G]VFN03071.1 MAG: 3-oxoacyl-[acyl-carrier protein] reductase [Candidatus Kentron sp. G]